MRSCWTRTHLENLYLVFRVSPYAKHSARSIKKAGKYYFYDLGRIEGNESQKLENLVALSLKKEIERMEDCQGIKGSLNFLRTKEGKEIDFFVQQKGRLSRMFEVKLSDGKPSSSFDLFIRLSKEPVQSVQLVRNLDREYTARNGVRVAAALGFLENLNFGRSE